MKTVGPGGRGVALGMHADLVGETVALLAVAGRAGGNDVLPDRLTAAAPRNDMVHGETRLARAAVLTGPAVARQHGLAGDPAAMDVARDPDEADQPDHLRPVESHRLRAQNAVTALEHLGLLLEQEDQGAPHGADVEGLVARVEDQHPSAGQAAGGGYCYLAVDVTVLSRLVAVLMGGLMAVDRNPLCGGPVAHVPRDCSRANTRPSRGTPGGAAIGQLPRTRTVSALARSASIAADRGRRVPPPRCRGRTGSARGRAGAASTRFASG